MTRKVYDDELAEEFSKHFYPVDSFISIADAGNRRTFSVWNDRPQAGSVHSSRLSGGIKLLLDRRLTTNDKGGIPRPMYLEYGKNLELSFKFQMHDPSAIDKSMI